MKKCFYIAMILVCSCGSEPENNTGKIVNETEEKDTVENTDNNKDTSSNVLEANTPDLIQKPDGTRIEFTQHGNGDKLKKGDMVEVNYKTFLPDGKQIDGSEILNRPLLYFIGINMSIKGWDEIFMELREGDKIKLHLPSEKAYGKKGFGTMVPPNTALDFEIEVLEKIKPNVTASGLKYYHLVKKDGAKATKEGGKIDIHYYGWVYKTGKLFDSSHFNGKTYRFTVGAGEEILCWEEIVKQMKEGEKVLMYVPAKLAYAEKGIPELVPPGADVVFIIEMMDVL